MKSSLNQNNVVVDSSCDNNNSNDDEATFSDDKEGTTTTTTTNDEPNKNIIQRLYTFYERNSFLIRVVIVTLIASVYPPLGAKYVARQITATYIAVIIIFILSGLGLQTREFKKAFQRLKFNAFVQLYNFGCVSAITYGFSKLMVVSTAGALSKQSANGMIICSSMSCTVNMVIILTKSSGGDEAAAVLNAALGNMIGVFISPLLILLYLGVDAEVDLALVFFKVGVRVVLPVLVGQILQKCCPPIVNFTKQNKKHFKTIQEYCLIFIIYTVACTTFDNWDESSTGIGDVLLMVGLQFVLLSSLMTLAWFLLKLFFRNEPKIRVMGLFGCTHKSIAIGIPMINAIFEDNPLIGFYTLPLLIWHPMQLIIGSFLAPRLAKFVTGEEERVKPAYDLKKPDVTTVSA